MSVRRDFLEVPRRTSPYRAVADRVRDHRELIHPLPLATVEAQAGRCMDCGVPFCHNACPLNNLIPEWNGLARTGDWRGASANLATTNNFPEFTGWLCPAPCEPACVLAIGGDAVSIKEIERTTIETAFANGWIHPEPPAFRTGRSVAVVGSGPAGLAAAQQLNRAGHRVVVYERADRPGGLLRYGIPDFKMGKGLLDRRLDLLSAEGITFECNYDCGVDVSGEELLERHDAVVLAVGAERARDVELPGRHLDGIHLAMDYLTGQNRRVAGAPDEVISAAGRNVVIIGGGDTAADCLGDSHREACASVQQLVIYPEPPRVRPASNPWPQWPLVLRNHAAHEEGGVRAFGVEVMGFEGEAGGRVRGITVVEVDRGRDGSSSRGLLRRAGTERVIEADLVLLAIGFSGVRESPLFEQLGVELVDGTRIAVDGGLRAGREVTAGGDAVLGAALVVDAIAQGRRAAATCDRLLQEEFQAAAV
ncbi:MAG: glutamate synthase subunit beta [Candidatus Dormibacteraeota bacterium]|uniref:Glutamate synthase n=1 Tax=Candidatus Aeolococcus gillhamiae TaxID=3127015 RepID=A0A2W6AS19_9BACT|nr:glutamate synthase subunit beta [Candidatus Dormibacteraeota bacterium]PZR80601.1 MAG: glutamate synthase [Candidatus Dormibacter sp. RRmetagenome_bin12]